ncbi:hypothetical protein [Acetobacter oeni]|uniref:Uncharacterized protein n=1 Tax=Acetobacter oeni TaxID=304077 RepID=A0A511XN11_9PROT|nr:hypothetical protein [Acetobacter oeni]MBB3881584.1 hypothetical protein [Acetobacter oeni]GBR04889.1 hypothetical protein AA21952_1559 [Acetobacter oeni LMG 21952]GEN64326.1 hypothetical protein AOE01nite_25500 [Acetobacter oeni]
MPRGTGELGFYVGKERTVAIWGGTPAVDLPVAKRPRVQVMRTDSPVFSAYLAARASRTDLFFVRAAHGVALCNAPVPVRQAP